MPQGIGWYRYEFTAPAEWKNKTVTMEFEGVYMNAQFWLNGEKIADHPYGYTSFFLDLSKAKWGEKNVIAVRIDNSGQLNSRWYPGSGIERHVWMNVANPTHFAPWGVYVVTKTASSDAAQIELEAHVQSASPAAGPLVLRTAVVDSSGKTVATAESPLASGDAKESSVKQQLQITKPSLWSPESPELYHAHVSLVQEGKVVDACSTPFGVRTLKWSAEKGLELNGKSIKLAGGCIHQCNGALGGACFDRGEERRVQLLKAAGFNAVRLAHGPASPALLDACDRLGMLVMAEAFDCWDIEKVPYDYHLYFKDWWQRDLDSFILRDRNHPSIVMWSIGNEIRGQYEAPAYATGEQISARLRTMDTTRPVTQGMNARPRKTDAAMAAWDAYCAKALDIVGTNYRLEVVAQNDHPRVPERMVVSTEEVPSDAFRYWMLTLNNSYAVGDFVWTAWDYLGESSNGHWTLRKGGDENTKVRGPRAMVRAPATSMRRANARTSPTTETSSTIAARNCISPSNCHSIRAKRSNSAIGAYIPRCRRGTGGASRASRSKWMFTPGMTPFGCTRTASSSASSRRRSKRNTRPPSRLIINPVRSRRLGWREAKRSTGNPSRPPVRPCG